MCIIVFCKIFPLSKNKKTTNEVFVFSEAKSSQKKSASFFFCPDSSFSFPSSSSSFLNGLVFCKFLSLKKQKQNGGQISHTGRAESGGAETCHFDRRSGK
jgi:hypothetical protein